jgi:NNP family nitrate/nitrite transporter-like MFS transporter
MGIGNAAVFEMVPRVVPDAVGAHPAGSAASEAQARSSSSRPRHLRRRLRTIGYARAFVVFAVLSTICVGIATTLRSRERTTETTVTVAH